MTKTPILCIDPDEQIRRAMVRRLSENFEVKVSPGGEEEVRYYLTNERFDVVIVNEYPGMPIATLINMIRSKYERMPIIVFDTEVPILNCAVDEQVFKGNWQELEASIADCAENGRVEAHF